MGGENRVAGRDFIDARMQAESACDEGSSRSGSARDFMEAMTGLVQMLTQVLGMFMNKGGMKGGGGGGKGI